MPRDYKREYREFHSRPEEIKRRAARNKARRLTEREGRVRKGDGKDVDHRNHNPADNSKANRRVLPKSVNRAMNRKRNG